MLPFRHVDGHNPGQWLGLIDAVYGIGMTLMAFGLPKTLNTIAAQYIHRPQNFVNQIIDLALSTADYFLIFLVLYEVWCFHRTILMASSNPPHRMHGQITAMILAIVSITPAFTDFLLNGQIHTILSLENPGLAFFHIRPTAFILLFLAAITYGLLTIFSSINSSKGNRSVLRLCRRSAGYRCLIFTILFVASLAAYNYTQTWLRPNALILVYLIFSYHQDHVLQLMNRQRRP